jgi:hypothetical protein
MLRLAFTQVQVIVVGVIEFELLLLIPHIVKPSLKLPESNQLTVLEKSVGFHNGRIHIRLLLLFSNGIQMVE